MIFKARQTVGQGGAAVIDQNFKDVETSIAAIQAANPAPSVTSTSKDYAASVNDVHIFASGTVTVTLADATKLKGRPMSVKNTGTGTVTVAASRSQKVDGNASLSLSAGDSASLVSDGANWWDV